MSPAKSVFPARCAGRFEPVRALAEGGYGTVWLANDRALGRAAVVKLLRVAPGTGDDEIARFLDEAKITAAIEHRHVVRVLEHGADDVPWIAYELLAGPSLRAALDAGPLPIAEAADAIAQTAAGVAEAHRRGVLHRDLKPDNVMSDGHGTWKVTDFGIAKCASASVKTATGVLLGTPYYLSPEQIRGEGASERSDVYALGIMLHELLTGAVPFGGDQVFAVLERHLKSRVPAPSARRAGVPRALDALVLACTEPDPAQRMSSMTAVGEALDRVRAEEAGEVSAATPGSASASPARTAAIARSRGTSRPVAATVAARVEPRRPPPAVIAAALTVGVVGLLGAFVRPRPAVEPASVASPPPVASAAAAPSPSRSPGARLAELDERLPWLMRQAKGARDPALARELGEVFSERARLQRAAARPADARKTYDEWSKWAKSGYADGLADALAGRDDLEHAVHIAWEQRNQAIVALQAHRIDEGARLVAEAMKVDRCGDMVLVESYVARERKQPELERKLVLDATRMGGNDPWLHSTAGELARKDGNCAAAIVEYEKALRAETPPAIALVGLAMCLEDKDPGAAEKHLERAVAIEHAPWVTLAHLQFLVRHHPERVVEQAGRECAHVAAEEGLAAGRTRAKIYRQVADQLGQRQKIEIAIALLVQAIELAPDDDETWKVLGPVMVAQHKQLELIKLCDDWLRRPERPKAAMATRAWANAMR